MLLKCQFLNTRDRLRHILLEKRDVHVFEKSLLFVPYSQTFVSDFEETQS